MEGLPACSEPRGTRRTRRCGQGRAHLWPGDIGSAPASDSGALKSQQGRDPPVGKTRGQERKEPHTSERRPSDPQDRPTLGKTRCANGETESGEVRT